MNYEHYTFLRDFSRIFSCLLVFYYSKYNDDDGSNNDTFFKHSDTLCGVWCMNV